MEFKKLSDVEVVAKPSESANILIEENGIIKKAPKTAVGGAGGAISTYYIYVEDWNNSPLFVSDGLYNGLKDMLDNRAPADIVMYILDSSTNSWTKKDSLSFSYDHYIDGRVQIGHNIGAIYVTQDEIYASWPD